MPILVEPAMLRRQIGGSGGEAGSAIDVHRFRQILMQRPLNHYLLAYVAQRVGDCARRYVASEHMAHVLAG